MRKVDLVLGFVLVAVCGFFYILTSQLPESARLYPMFVISVLLFLTFIHLAISYRNKSDEESKEFKDLEIKQLLFVLGLSGLYVALIRITGYISSTFLYVAVALFGLKVDKKLSLAISIGFAIFIYVLFKVFLRVPLPKGFLI